MLRVMKQWAVVGVVGLLAPALWTSQASATELNLTGDSQYGPICDDGGSGACAPGGAAGFQDLGGGLYMFYGAIYTVNTQQPTGSGYIDSFVRIMDQSGTDYYVVDGHNTSAPQQSYLNDEKPGPTFTTDALTSTLQKTTINGIDYYRFLLDINQTGTDPILSLSGLQLCTAGTGGLVFDGTCANSASAGPTTSTMRYDLDGAANYPDAQPTDPANYNTAQAENNVLLDYNLNSGSGSGDLWVYIPKSTLLPGSITDNNDYLYLWSQFGIPKPFGNNDGYEEWAFMHQGTGNNEFLPLTGAPEPATLVMLGTGLLFGGAAVRRRNRKQVDNSGTK